MLACGIWGMAPADCAEIWNDSLANLNSWSVVNGSKVGDGTGFFGPSEAVNYIERSITYKPNAYKAKWTTSVTNTNGATLSTSAHRWRLGAGTSYYVGPQASTGYAAYVQYFNGSAWTVTGSLWGTAFREMSITVDDATDQLTFVVSGLSTWTVARTISSLPTSARIGGPTTSPQDAWKFDWVKVEQWYYPTTAIGAPSATWAKQGDVVNYTVTYGNYATITLGAANVTLNQAGVSGSTRTVTGTSGATRTVAVTAGSGDGTVSISVAANTATSDDGASSTARAFGPSATFSVDNTKPANPAAACSDSKASGAWRNTGSPSFTLSGASDGGSGLKTTAAERYRYYWGIDANGTPATLTDESVPAQTVSADGSYYLRVQTQDNVGNWSDPVTVFTFNYDATAPGAAPAYSTGASTTGIIVNFGASSGDNLSGLATAAYKVTRGSYDSGWVTSGPVTDPAADIADGGSATYTVTTIDNAGNQATDTVTGRKPLAATNNWVFTTKAISLAPPGLHPQQLAANTKVFASSDGQVYGFGGAAASALWVPVATGGAVQGRVIPATLAGELTALGGSQDGKVYARKVSDGTARWTHDFGGSPVFKVTAKPAGVIGVTVNGSYTGDVVFAATDADSDQNMLRAFQAGDGTVLWTYSATLGPILGSPLVLPSKGLVVFATMPGGSDTGRVVAVNIADGSLEWQNTAVGDVRSAVSPDGAEATVFAVNQSGQLYALDSSNGTAKSGFPVSVGATGIYGAPMWHGNGPRLYVSSLGDTFYALNPANGGTATGWSSSVSVTGPSNPVVFNQRVYVGSADGNLYEYNINTGAQTGYRAIGSTVGDPVVDAWLSRIYVGAGDGRIYSFSLPF